MKNYVVNLQNYVFCATFPNLRAITFIHKHIHSNTQKKNKKRSAETTPRFYGSDIFGSQKEGI